jgi:uncharacterized protein (DUF952 family)
MSVRCIYHLCRKADWLAAAQKGVYEGSAEDKADGFMHFSTADPGEAELLLLVVNAASLGDKLVWEASSSGEMFPHLQGALPLSSVLEVVDLILGPDGMHEFPLLAD